MILGAEHGETLTVSSNREQSAFGSTQSVLLVDGFNVLHSVILQGRNRAHWWSLANQEQVVKLVGSYRGPGECCVVFDAARMESERIVSKGDLPVFYAPSADDWIVEQVERRRAAPVIVVSADRSLLDRSQARGASRMSPWQFALSCGA